jgi:Tfp pilus assembly protein PilN
MMRRVELLPASYAEKRRQRQTLSAIVVVGIALVGLVILWWFFLGNQISDAESDLAEVQAINADLQEQIDELQIYADLENEVNTKTAALVSVMTGDVDWPALMTEIAMIVPGEVWFDSLQASAAVLENATSVPTETAPVDINPKTVFGRISFSGRSLTMPGVAKWLIQLTKVNEFDAIWLNDANLTEATSDQPAVATFTNTVELGTKAASERLLDLGEPQ